MADDGIERFHPTSGRAAGVVGLALVAVLLAVAALDGAPVWMFGGLAVIGVLVWASMLRPRVQIADDRLELRNMFVDVDIPVGAIEQVAVRQVLAVRAGDRRFVSPAIGRTLRQVVRSGRRGEAAGAGGEERDLVALATASYPDYVEERIRLAAADHRKRLGVTRWSQEQQALALDVRREPARPELGALAVAALVLLVGIVLAL
jgi:hypothetical protein